MKIVNTDNFGGDYPDEKFVCLVLTDGTNNDGPLLELPQDIAKRIADALNDWRGERSVRFCKVVPNDYKLRPGFEP